MIFSIVLFITKGVKKNFFDVFIIPMILKCIIIDNLIDGLFSIEKQVSNAKIKDF